MLRTLPGIEQALYKWHFISSIRKWIGIKENFILKKNISSRGGGERKQRRRRAGAEKNEKRIERKRREGREKERRGWEAGEGGNKRKNMFRHSISFSKMLGE